MPERTDAKTNELDLDDALLCNGCYHTELCTLSLHDALPICAAPARALGGHPGRAARGSGSPFPDAGQGSAAPPRSSPLPDRKSTRLNSSHVATSYAVIRLKKKIAAISKSFVLLLFALLLSLL